MGESKVVTSDVTAICAHRADFSVGLSPETFSAAELHFSGLARLRSGASAESPQERLTMELLKQAAAAVYAQLPRSRPC